LEEEECEDEDAAAGSDDEDDLIGASAVFSGLSLFAFARSPRPEGEPPAAVDAVLPAKFFVRAGWGGATASEPAQEGLVECASGPAQSIGGRRAFKDSDSSDDGPASALLDEILGTES